MSNILLTPHFALLEFTESTTASKHGINNSPTPEVQENLRRLCEQTLEPLREALGLPVVITSGYRCKELNDLISHHAHKSQHLKGQAADFYVGWSAPVGGRGQATGNKPSPRERLVKAFHLILTDPKIDFDQLIIYPSFVHVSYVSPEANRHYIMTARASGHYQRVSKEVALSIQ